MKILLPYHLSPITYHLFSTEMLALRVAPPLRPPGAPRSGGKGGSRYMPWLWLFGECCTKTSFNIEVRTAPET